MYHKVPQFLASEIPDLPPESCRFHVIPAPYEKTVSYGGGTADGPWAILRASYQLEAFDGTSEPCKQGIFTHPPCANLEAVSAAVDNVLKQHHTPVVLGGEHTVTVGVIQALQRHHDDFGVVQFDAHADLRDQYEGTPWSHACVMKRILDMKVPIMAIGTRSLSKAEDALRRTQHIPCLDAVELAADNLPNIVLPDDFPSHVYVTFDVDALDPSVIPSTGTPEPGGLTWYQALSLFELISRERKIIGFDVVELAPVEGLHASDYTAARLIYNFMGFISRST